MENTFIHLLEHGCEDLPLSPHQLGLLRAQICRFTEQGSWPQIRVSRSKLMCLGHIQSTSIFHKYISKLVFFANIDDKPAYHSAGRMLVRILPAGN